MNRITRWLALFLIMYETWAMFLDLNTVNVDLESDPDHPNVTKLAIHSTKKDRTGVGMLTIIQRTDLCLRLLFANYLVDTSLDALRFTSLACCDRHPGTGFHVRRYFKGRLLYQDPNTLDLFYGDVDEPDHQKVMQPLKAKLKATTKSRPTKNREELVARLHLWRLDASTKDSLASVRPASFIIDNKSIIKLSKINPTEITQERIVTELDETEEWRDEWAGKIFEVIQKYAKELAALQDAEDTRASRIK
ncbi:hypothetical protein BDZ97DRAFT_1800730 [Flammula alnicola]|nr:hypothetical protein BDZ97DRAFT_1800730 [Flammula alnicola]